MKNELIVKLVGVSVFGVGCTVAGYFHGVRSQKKYVKNAATVALLSQDLVEGVELLLAGEVEDHEEFQRNMNEKLVFFDSALDAMG